MRRHRLLSALPALAAALLSAALLGACGSVDRAEPDDGTYTPPLALTLAHVNDHHSNLDAIAGTELLLGGQPTRVELGGFARIIQAFNAYAGRDDVLRLHAGDASTGTLYYTLFKGEADARLMNSVCFDAMAVGNHEFDDGDAQLRRFIDHLHAERCQTPVLAANVRPQVGTPLAPQAADDFLKPYTVRLVRGVPVGIVGITVASATQNASRPLATTAFDDEVASAQRSIDALKAQGVRHIVLLTHQGYQADLAMAAQLTDVDAIVGGHSHTLLGDFSALGAGLTSAGPYPTQATNKDGQPVCIGQAWEYGKAMGEMRLTFNERGELTSCQGQASLLIGQQFQRKAADGSWANVDEATRQQILTALATEPRVKALAPDMAAGALLHSYAAQVAARKAQTIGSASEALCAVRVPGETINRSAGVAGCETANQRAHGSDVAQVVAESFLHALPQADLAILNGGAVRVPVAPGPLTMNTAFTLLPFTNTLVQLPVTGEQLLAVLEDAIANYMDDALSSGGAHPYAAGLRWDLDLTQPRGQRLRHLQVRARASGTWQALEMARTYQVATIDYLASGKDGYARFAPLYDSDQAFNTYVNYTQAFVDYVMDRGTIGRPAPGDYANQSVIAADGRRLP